MLRKKFIFENEEEVEKNDFQTILDLNKKRVSPYDVEFTDSKGNDFLDIIKVTQSGLLFTFDGLKDYLKFFFPDEYGEDNTDGEWDAVNFEAMYDGNWNWYDEFSDRHYEDWNDGYIADYFTNEQLKLIKDIPKYMAPSVFSLIQKNDKGFYMLKGEKDNRTVCGFLDTIELGDQILDAYSEASVLATSDAVKEGIKDRYCDCLYTVGIQRYSDNYCFWKYELDWGSAILLFARFGTQNDKLLDLLFYGINKSSIRHLPVYYEMQYEYWDNEKFRKFWDSEVTEILEKKLESILEDDTLNTEYYKIVNKVVELGGIGSWLATKDKKYQIKIDNIDDETNKIQYSIKKMNDWRVAKRGKTDIDSLVNMFYNQFLIDPFTY